MTWRAIGALALLLLVSSQSAGSEVDRAALLQELNLTGDDEVKLFYDTDINGRLLLFNF